MKTCSKCGKSLRRDNTKGICGQAAACAKRAAGSAAPAVKPPPPVGSEKKAKKVAAVLWLERFRQLHAALGLDAEEAIETHCRTWVEATTSRALAQSAKPVRLHPPRADPVDVAAAGE